MGRPATGSFACSQLPVADAFFIFLLMTETEMLSKLQNNMPMVRPPTMDS
jgi:hypothetical protein